LNYQNKNYYFLKNKHKLIKIIKTLENPIKIKKKHCIKEREKKKKKKFRHGRLAWMAQHAWASQLELMRPSQFLFFSY